MTVGRSSRGVRSARVLVLAGTLVGSLLVAPATTLAANPEGQPATAFSGDGAVTHQVDESDFVGASTITADGRLLLAGTANDGSVNAPVVLRLTTSGALDTTFGGGDGIATTPVADGYAGEIAVGSDGRIVVAGSTSTEGSDGVGWVMRLGPTGSPDTSFSGDGVATIEIPGFDVELEGVAIDASGRIVVAGNRQTESSSEVLVARLTGAGALDTSFSGDGLVTDDGLGRAYAVAVAAHPDGGVAYLAGTTPDQLASSVQVARLDAAGAPMAAFGGTGTITLDLESSTSYASDVLVQPDGLVLASATTGNEMVLVRLAGNGSLDGSFGTAGRFTSTTFGSSTEAHHMALEPNGRIVVTGTLGSDFWVARVLPSGVYDPTFGDAGTAIGDVVTQYDSPVGVDIAPNGRILVGLNAQTDTVNVFGAAAFTGDATRPFGARVIAGSRFVTSSSRTIRWTASDDNTGIRDFDVRYRSAAYSSSSLGSATTWRSNTTATSASFTGSAGRTYCLEVRADDNAGNVGAFGSPACIAFPVNDRSLARSGSWTSVSSSAYYRGTASRSTDSGARLTRTGVDYRTLAVVATTCSTCGKVTVYLGSTKLATLDLKSSTTKRRQVFIVDTSATVKSGTVSIRQASGGKPVIIEGLGVSLQ